jgi:hypothetical protein
MSQYLSIIGISSAITNLRTLDLEDLTFSSKIIVFDANNKLLYKV